MTADDIAARHRYNTIRHSIPDRLDRVADQLDDCLALVARYGLAESLQPGFTPYHAVVQGLHDAATRIRTAAKHIPRPKPLPAGQTVEPRGTRGTATRHKDSGR